jgi:putative DNA primase/helicase
MAKNQQQKPADKEEKKPFHVVVAEGLIKQLEAGTAPWQKPWEAGQTGTLPMNLTTGRRYRGINSIQLMMQGREDNRWLTYKQAEAVGAQVRRGERGTLVQYWKFEDERTKIDEQGRPVKGADGEPEKDRVLLERPKVFHAVVFNAEQIDGLPPAIKQAQRWDASERAESILKASGADISHAAGDRAFYRPSTDSITMPYREQFKTANAYYAIALHELGHWTGHESRLGRDLANPFGSEAYAKEELRAEIASMLMGDELAIGHDPGQHAAYVKSWVKVLKDDPMEILRASADAEKIHSFVMAFEQQQVQSTTESQAVEQPGYAQTAALYQAMNSADEAFRNELVRVYGEDRAGDARYKPHHEDVDVQKAADNFVKASVAWHTAVEEARTKQIQEARMVTISDPVKLLKTHGEQVHDGLDAVGRWNEGQRLFGFHEQGGDPVEIQSIAELGAYAPDQLMALSPVNVLQEQDQDHVEKTQLGFLGGVVNEAKAAAVALKELWEVNPGFSGDPNEFFAESAAIARKEDRKAKEYQAMRQDRIDRATEWTPDQAAQQAKADAQAYQEQGDPTERGFMRDDMALNAASNGHYRDALASVAPEVLEVQKSNQAQSQRQFVDVPFKQKDDAKKLGAKWDRAAQSWYVPPGVNPEPFAKWAQKGADAPQASEQTRANTQAAPKPETAQSDRVYLAVPYTERVEAKAAGAAWDKAAKSWYVGPSADAAKLERWKPENVKQQQDPAMTPRDEFADALRSMQCVVEGEHPIMDGQRHRIKVIGDDGKEAAGFYVGHLDGHPAGYIKNNRSGEEMRWKSTGYRMSESDKAKLRAEAADKLAERAAQQEQAQNATADRLGKQLAGLKPVEQPTTYMQAKGIAAHVGAFTDAEGQKTYIPATDADGKVWTMQYIQEDGTKRFAKDSRKEGCFHVVGGGLDSVASAPALVIAEGYATAATLAEGLGHATVAAFDSGNLKAVALALNAKFPDKPVIIAGDDDRHLPMTLGNNPGREKAIEAAAAVGGQAVFPVFAPGEAEWPEGVKPITPEAYKKHQAAATALEAGGQTPEQAASLKAELLSREQLDALAKLKRHTDFNDLASRSTLGREGITRQVSAATSLAIEQKHELANKHQQARAQDEPQEQQRPRKAAKIG